MGDESDRVSGGWPELQSWAGNPPRSVVMGVAGIAVYAVILLLQAISGIAQSLDTPSAIWPTVVGILVACGFRLGLLTLGAIRVLRGVRGGIWIVSAVIALLVGGLVWSWALSAISPLDFPSAAPSPLGDLTLIGYALLTAGGVALWLPGSRRYIARRRAERAADPEKAARDAR